MRSYGKSAEKRSTIECELHAIKKQLAKAHGDAFDQERDPAKIHNHHADIPTDRLPYYSSSGIQAFPPVSTMASQTEPLAVPTKSVPAPRTYTSTSVLSLPPPAPRPTPDHALPAVSKSSSYVQITRTHPMPSHRSPQRVYSRCSPPTDFKSRRAASHQADQILAELFSDLRLGGTMGASGTPCIKVHWSGISASSSHW